MASIKEKTTWALFAAGKTPASPEVKALGLKSSTTHLYHYRWKSEGKPKTPMPEGSGDLLKAVNKLTDVVSKQTKKTGKSAKTGTTRTVLPGGETVGAYELPSFRPGDDKKSTVSMDEPDELDAEIAKIEKAEGYSGVIPPPEAGIDAEELEEEVAGVQEGEDNGHNKEAPPPRPNIDFELGDNHDGKKTIPSTIIGAGLPVSVTLSLKTLSFYEIASTIQKGLTLGDFIDQVAEDFFTGRGRDLGLIKME